MTITESLRVALRALAANKLRSLLTMLGMIIGVASVIAVMSIGRGTTSTVTARISDMGSNLVFVRPGAQTQGGVRTQQGSAPTLTMDDAEAIIEGQLPGVGLVAPEYGTSSQIAAGSLNVNSRVLGVTETYEIVRNYPVEFGEFISPQHIESRATVVVLGANVAQSLFPDADPVGQSLRISRQPFRVIGVLKAKGSTGFGSQDDQALVPISTLHTRLLSQRSSRGGQQVNVINIQAATEKDVTTVKEQIAEVLRVRHRITGEDDFTVSSQEDTLATLNQITEVMTMFLGSIAAISLLVGGIGIMNIMLVSVTERTREIGIRKAIGARRKDILMQFLTEATVISVTGGGIGFLLGTGIAMALPNIQLGSQPLNTVVSFDIAALAMTVSAAIGLFFGIYPAMRAARLHPIEALRHE